MIDHCVILAAGRNTRLDTGKPKSLLELNDISLLERHITRFKAVGIKSFCIVTGYQRQTIEAVVPAIIKNHKVEIHTIHNPKFDLENGYSLGQVKPWLSENGVNRFMLTMGDHVFEHGFVKDFHSRCLNKKNYKLLLAVDKPGITNAHIDLEDVTRVLTSEMGDIVNIGKLIEKYNYYDTGLFCLNSIIMTTLSACFRKNQNSISDMVNELVKENQASTLSISGYQWNDIDNPDDFNTTKRLNLD
jgi:choline kinase